MTARIIIVGAGLGGLSAALAVRRAGYDVTVLERAASFSGTAGAGLTVTAPGMAALKALGLEAETLAISAPAPSTPLIHWATGKVFHDRVVPNLDDAAGTGEHRFIPRVTHRADMHKLLLDGAIRAGVEVVTGATVIDITQDAHGVRAVLADGRDVPGAILIGADGLRSRVRTLLVGEADPVHSGAVAWRALVPAELVQDLLGGMDIAIHFGPTAQFMRYLVRQRSMLNCVGIIKTDAHAQDGWSTPSTIDELIAELPGWHHGLIDLIRRIPDGMLYKWPLLDRDPITQWVDGRVALLGDAAHPMLPTYGIGATIAMEDGVVLGRALTATGDPVAALAVYERARLERGGVGHARIAAGRRRLHERTCPRRDYRGPLLAWDIYAYDPATVPLA